MRHRTIHACRARKAITVAFILFAVSVAALVCAGRAWADPYGDPHLPDPSRLWCPGGGTANYYGAYCEGISYPDGTRWNYYRTGWYWQPGPRCIVENSGIIPVLAPNGCGQ
jgi:hypothetical protein